MLDPMRTPADLRNFPTARLRQLIAELRAEIIDVVSMNGGHRGPSLGVIELTVALHAFRRTAPDRY